MPQQRYLQDEVHRGDFLTLDGGRAFVRGHELPDDLAKSERAAQAAAKLAEIKRRHAVAVTEIARRLELVKASLDAVRAKAKRK